MPAVRARLPPAPAQAAPAPVPLPPVERRSLATMGPLWARDPVPAQRFGAEAPRAGAVQDLQAAAGNAAVQAALKGARPAPAGGLPAAAPPGAGPAAARPTGKAAGTAGAKPAASGSVAVPGVAPGAAQGVPPDTADTAPTPAAAGGKAAKPVPAPAAPGGGTADVSGLNPQPGQAMTPAQAQAGMQRSVDSLPKPPGGAGRPADGMKPSVADAAGKTGRDPGAAAAHAHRLAGQPPVPEKAPPPIPDPTPEATKKVETAAARTLPDQTLPALAKSPGGNMPDLTQPAIRAPDVRLLLASGDQAALKNLIKLAGTEDEAKELKRIQDLRQSLMPPTDAAPQGVSVPPPEPLPPLKIVSEPLPEATVTPTQRRFYTLVIARMLADVDDTAREIVHEVKRGMYPRGVLQRQLPDLGADLIPNVAPRVRASIEPLAGLLGIAGDQLDQAIADRRQQVEEEKKKASGTAEANASQAAAQASDTAQAKAARAAAAAKAVAHNAEARAKQAKAAEKPSVKDRVEAQIHRIQDKVGEAIARYEMLLSDRNQALDKAKERESAAIRRAQLQDELALQSPNDKHPAAERPRRAAESRNWADGEIAKIEDQIKQFKEAAAKLVRGGKDAGPGYISEVESAGAAAYTDLQAWSVAQGADKEGWWKGVADNLGQWAKNAHDRTTTWASAEAHAARLTLLRDFGTIMDVAKVEADLGAEQAHQYVDGLDAQRRAIVNMWKPEYAGVAPEPGKAEPGGNIFGALFFGLRRQLVDSQKGVLEPELDSRLLAMPPDNWPELDIIAKAKNPGFSAARILKQVDGAINKLKTDKESLFGALNGLSPLELAILRKAYGKVHPGKSLDDVLQKNLFWDEDKKHAAALMRGDQDAADVATFFDAMSGPGTKKKPVMDLLRSLPPERREKVKQMYLDSHGESLEAAIRDDFSGSELDQALALMKGDTAAADAYAIDYAVRGHVVASDLGEVTAVYDGIRAEVTARAKRENWTSAQLEGEIARRNALIEASFNKQFAGVADYTAKTPDRGPLRGAFAYGFTPAEKDLADALAKNDLVAADAARIQVERKSSIYADDDVLNKVLRSQYDRALEARQLDEGPERRAGMDQEFKRQVTKAREDGHPMTEAEQMNLRLKLERDVNKGLEDAAGADSKNNMKVLGQLFKRTYGGSLKAIIRDNMSGYSEEEAYKRLENGGNLSPEDRLYYSIYGPGTNLPELRSTLNSLSKPELDKIDEKWRREHGHSLIEDIKGDTSGRDEEDLVDLAEHGAPQTIEEQVAQLQRRQDTDAKGQTLIGKWASKDEAEWTQDELARLQATVKQLEDPNLKPEERERLHEQFDEHVENAREAIDAQRQAVDAVADMASSIFTYAVAAIALVVGTVAAIFTGGASLALAIAIAASLVGTLGSMAIKGAVRGSAYGIEEIGVDAAIGAVDLIVTVATAGLGKGAAGLSMKAAMTELRTVGKEAGKWLARGLGEAALNAARSAKGFLGQGIKEIAKQSALEVAKLVPEYATQFARAIPTTFVGAALDSNNWNQGNALGRIFGATMHGAVENANFGMAMHAAGGMLKTTLGATVRPPATSAIQARAYEYTDWQRKNPGKPRAAFVAEMETRQAEQTRDTAKAHRELRAMRKELLSGLPAAERGSIADVPIERVSKEQFRAMNKGVPGEAMVRVHEGQATLIVAEGAPTSALHDQIPKLRETVAEGTGGRTKNPNESLPARLRNRVEIVPDTTGELKGNTVRVELAYDARGNIIGAKMHLGPNARAGDIQAHVGVVDAMRDYAGLLGRVRLALDAVALKLKMDVTTPLRPAEFEARLELMKLDPIIKERLQRLDEAPTPEAAAALTEDIAHLRSQVEAAHEVLRTGAEGPGRGFVAMEGMERKRGGRKKAPAAEEEPATPAAKAAAKPAKKPAKQSSEVPDRQRQVKASEVKMRLETEAAEESKSIRGTSESRSEIEAKLKQLIEAKKMRPPELDKAFGELPPIEDPQARLEAVEELLTKTREREATPENERPGLREEAVKYLEWQRDVLRAKAELEDIRGGTIQAGTKLERLHGVALPAAEAELRTASKAVRELLRSEGPNYKAKSGVGFDEILGQERWDDHVASQAAISKKHGAVARKLATDHLVPLDTIGNRTELAAFLALYERASPEVKAKMTKDLVDLGDKPYNLKRMNWRANSVVKGSRSWAQITYDEVREFGYKPADVDAMRAAEAKALGKILGEIDDLTKRYTRIVGGGSP